MARYGLAMIDDSARPGTADAVETALRERLAHDEAMAGTVVPVLRHLLANENASLFSDEIVARVRGMVGDLAHQLLDRQDAHGPDQHAPEAVSALADVLIASPALLVHCHAVALEWRLTERLQVQIALDPVLPPLLQALVESVDPATAGLAMQLLAAQARFGQAQRRMRLPLAELPGDLLHAALVAMRVAAGVEPQADAEAAAAEAAIRAAYDESRGRLGLLSRLVASLGGGAVAALSIAHAGAAIFLTALASASAQDRDIVVLSTDEAQIARFAIALRAAGLKLAAIEEQLLSIHVESALPEGIERLGPSRALDLLSAIDGQPWN